MYCSEAARKRFHLTITRLFSRHLPAAARLNLPVDATLVERVTGLTDHDRFGWVARDRRGFVLDEQSRRTRAGAVDADDDPAYVSCVYATTRDPAVPVLVVEDGALTDEVLAVDREDVVDPEISHSPFQELVSSARSELFLRTAASCERLATLVRSDPYGRNAAQHGEHHEQDPNHEGEYLRRSALAQYVGDP